MASDDEVEHDYIAMCKRVLEREADHAVLILCISSLKDVWGLLQADERLFSAKAHSVTIMGGIELDDSADIAHAEAEGSFQGGNGGKVNTVESGTVTDRTAALIQGYEKSSRRRSEALITAGVGGSTDQSARFLKPDTANNNTFDFEAAINFHARVQVSRGIIPHHQPLHKCL